MTATAAVANAANELRVANGRYAAGRRKPSTSWGRQTYPEGLDGQLVSQAGPAVALGKGCASVPAVAARWRSSAGVVLQYLTRLLVLIIG